MSVSSGDLLSPSTTRATYWRFRLLGKRQNLLYSRERLSLFKMTLIRASEL